MARRRPNRRQRDTAYSPDQVPMAFYSVAIIPGGGSTIVTFETSTQARLQQTADPALLAGIRLVGYDAAGDPVDEPCGLFTPGLPGLIGTQGEFLFAAEVDGTRSRRLIVPSHCPLLQGDSGQPLAGYYDPQGVAAMDLSGGWVVASFGGIDDFPLLMWPVSFSGDGEVDLTINTNDGANSPFTFDGLPPIYVNGQPPTGIADAGMGTLIVTYAAPMSASDTISFSEEWSQTVRGGLFQYMVPFNSLVPA